MTKKNDHLNIRLNEDTKRKLKQKAENLGLDLTGYIEKIANESVIFMDDNIKKFLEVLQVKIKK